MFPFSARYELRVNGKDIITGKIQLLVPVQALPQKSPHKKLRMGV